MERMTDREWDAGFSDGRSIATHEGYAAAEKVWFDLSEGTPYTKGFWAGMDSVKRLSRPRVIIPGVSALPEWAVYPEQG